MSRLRYWAWLLVLLLLVLLDCVLNAILQGSINETLSSRAHRMREKHQPYWWWLAGAIDVLFFWQDGHCQRCHDAEVKAGGAIRSVLAGRGLRKQPTDERGPGP